MNTLDTLLDDLNSLGWTISWAFQFSTDHWRLSIIRYEDIGEVQGTYISHCVDAPTFAEALEDAMSKMSEAEFEPAEVQVFSTEPAKGNLLSQLSLALPQAAPIRRRV